MIFGIKRKINNFNPYKVFLAIATNISQRLKIGFVVQGHKYKLIKNKNISLYTRSFFPPSLQIIIGKL